MAEPLPAKVALTLYRGDSRSWVDTFTIDGDPMDLTGYQVTAQIRATPDDTTAQAVIDVEILDAPGGQIRRTLTATEAAKLSGPKAYWDLQLVRTADGFTRTYLAGPVKIVADVTRL